jgi:hypothetical protein
MRAMTVRGPVEAQDLGVVSPHEHLLIAQDVSTKTQTKAYGGWGYAHSATTSSRGCAGPASPTPTSARCTWRTRPGSSPTYPRRALLDRANLASRRHRHDAASPERVRALVVVGRAFRGTRPLLPVELLDLDRQQ